MKANSANLLHTEQVISACLLRLSDHELLDLAIFNCSMIKKRVCFTEQPQASSAHQMIIDAAYFGRLYYLAFFIAVFEPAYDRNENRIGFINIINLQRC
jgi:hypothetical protein